MRFERLTLRLLTILLIGTGCSLAVEPEVVGSRHAQGTPAPAEISEAMKSAPDRTLGAQVYSENCTACHGVSGRGDGTSVMRGAITGVPNFADPATLSLSDPAAVFTIITEGRLEKFMPPWGGVLSEEERWAVTMHVYGFWHAVTDAQSAGR